MCYNKDVSRANFLINIVTTAIEYNLTGDVASHKICAGFFFFVGLMQLYDWFFWDHNKRSNSNWIVTKVAMITNHLQPIVLAILISKYEGRLGRASWLLVSIYTPLAIAYTIYIWDVVDYTVTDPTTKLLYWKWNDQKYGSPFYALFLATFSVLMYENFPSPLNVTLLAINLVSFVLAMYKTHYIGERWCEFASVIPVLLIALKLEHKL
ncbi:hypothetical protein BCR33DRAFT_720640, partial [Rhizoclosmatium globosum]